MSTTEGAVAVLLNANAKQVSDRVQGAIAHVVPAAGHLPLAQQRRGARHRPAVIDRRYDTVFIGGGDGTFVGFVNEIFDCLDQPPALELLGRPPHAPRFGMLQARHRQRRGRAGGRLLRPRRRHPRRPPARPRRRVPRHLRARPARGRRQALPVRGLRHRRRHHQRLRLDEPSLRVDPVASVRHGRTGLCARHRRPHPAHLLDSAAATRKSRS